MDGARAGRNYTAWPLVCFTGRCFDVIRSISCHILHSDHKKQSLGTYHLIGCPTVRSLRHVTQDSGKVRYVRDNDRLGIVEIIMQMRFQIIIKSTSP
ncbi:unnamed protein product [Soboliphyme baturini]|uniref:C2H2-type domain-containing protein n=1 Tax=Soboliphyme baturini TaxID=241478 RepID=A0A183J7T6_9BILA|nr:unnamed protein product [Soboliphyme baturini]